MSDNVNRLIDMFPLDEFDYHANGELTDEAATMMVAGIKALLSKDDKDGLALNGLANLIEERQKVREQRRQE